MKTLKKVLSVVLALAMVLSMTAIASAKTDFSDDAKITDREAIEVMNKLGVFIGSNGAVNPTGTLSRAEAAKLITYLDLGKDTAEALPALSVFSDVKAADWEAKYVAYLKDAGYVAGVGNNKFNPDGNVTGYEFAKMLLGVLGYDADAEKMIGTTWQIAISKLMRATGIGKNAKYVGNVAITREAAARMCLEALQATMVEYDFTGATITVNGAVVKTGAAAASKVNDADAKNIWNDDETQLAENLYGKDLKVTEKESDAFGRPAHEWKYKTTSIGTYADTADLVYTAEVKSGTIYTDLGLSSDIAASKTSVYVDGLDESGSHHNDKTAFAIEKGETTAKLGGNGTLVEVFYDSSDDSAVVVVINTYSATVGSVTAATAKDDRYITLKTNKVPETSNAGQLVKTFDTEDFAKKDVVSYTAAFNETYDAYYIQTVAALEKSASEKVTKLTSGKSFVAGETYSYSAKYNADVEVKNTYDIYLDQYGYALYMVKTDSVSNYAVIVGLGETASAYGEANRTGATLLLADGKTVTATIKMDTDVVLPSNNGLLTTQETGYVVTYTVGSDGVYTITSLAPYNLYGRIETTNGKSYVAVNKDNKGGDDRCFGTTETIYFVATPNSNNGYDSYKVYIGFENVPTIYKKNTTGFSFVCNKNVTSQVEAVYIVANKVEGVKGDGIFVLNDGSALVKEVGETYEVEYYVFPAVVDGSVTTVKLGKNVANAVVATQGDYAMITAALYDENNVITSGHADPFDWETKGTIAADKGVVGITPDSVDEYGVATGGTFYAYNEDTEVIVVSKDGKSLSVIDVEDIVTDADDIVKVNYATDNVYFETLCIKKVDAK